MGKLKMLFEALLFFPAVAVGMLCELARPGFEAGVGSVREEDVPVGEVEPVCPHGEHPDECQHVRCRH